MSYPWRLLVLLKNTFGSNAARAYPRGAAEEPWMRLLLLHVFQ